MEKCPVCKCSPCKCSGKCHKMLPALMILILAVVVLLANLGIISAQLNGILWPILLGLAAIFKMCACKKEHCGCGCGSGCGCKCHSERSPQ